jgi:shikimate kinase
VTPREETIIKLLAAEPTPRAEVIASTGWGIVETIEVVEALVQRGAVVYFPAGGNTRHGDARTGEILCLPAARETAMEAAHLRAMTRKRDARRARRAC